MPETEKRVKLRRPPTELTPGWWTPRILLLLWLSVFVNTVSLNTASVDAASLEIVVPAYFYPSPGSAWGDLVAAAGHVPLTAILNPASGPGEQRDNNYVAAVNDLRGAGGRVIGYVPTGFGNRALEEVLADIDAYRQFYDLDGIFIDEMNNRGAQGVLRFYGDIYSYVKSIDPHWELMGNPGQNTSESLLTWPVADRLVITEDVGENYDNFVPDDWVAEHSSDRFVHLIHTEASDTTMAKQLEIAVSRNAGAIYITDDALPNPWDRLPDYWQTELQQVADWKSSPDIHRDGFLDCEDVNRLTRAIVRGQNSVRFDLNGDGSVDVADRDRWLIEAGQAVGQSRIPSGDVNLDGRVDSADWEVISPNLFTESPSWCGGDVNTDGLIDGSDFNLWFGQHALASGKSEKPTVENTVPEPTWGRVFALFLLATICHIRRLVRDEPTCDR